MMLTNLVVSIIKGSPPPQPHFWQLSTSLKTELLSTLIRHCFFSTVTAFMVFHSPVQFLLIISMPSIFFFLILYRKIVICFYRFHFGSIFTSLCAFFSCIRMKMKLILQQRLTEVKCHNSLWHNWRIRSV